MTKKVSAYISAFLVFSTLLTLMVSPLAAQDVELYNAAGNEEGAEVVDISDSEISCTEEAGKIGELITKYSSLKPQHLTAYQTLWVTVSGFVSKAEVLGYDTAVLEGDLDELELLIDAFDTEYDTFLANLTSAQNNACATNEAAYVTSVRNVRESLGDVRGAARDLYNFYAEELRENIISLQKVTVVDEEVSDGQ